MITELCYFPGVYLSDLFQFVDCIVSSVHVRVTPVTGIPFPVLTQMHVRDEF